MGVKKGIRERAYIFLKLLELFIATCIVVMVLVLMAITLKEYLAGNVSLYDEEALNIFCSGCCPLQWRWSLSRCSFTITRSG